MNTRIVERRIYPTEFREVPGSNGRQRWATAVTYNTVDEYGTVWLPGCFTAGLAERMPTILYGHDWWNLDHVLGQGIDHREGDEGCEVLIEFADPDEVPAARLAMALTAPPAPVLRDVSVGFDREEWQRKEDLSPELLALGADEAIQVATMDELSIVVRGAVPGAQLRERRSWVIDGLVVREPPAPDSTEGPKPVPVVALPVRGTVAEDVVVGLARQVAAGELSHAEASAAIALYAETGIAPVAPVIAPAPPPADADVPDLELDAAVADALAVMERAR